ncbi:MAG: hypothetical protein QG652_902 [Pseudomonadota bacterium]|nr:hypothetical protein [Pseudomonadota bacterium]
MKQIIFILLFMFTITNALAEDSKPEKKLVAKKTANEVKELSGISIIGNKEAPKSLYIVPWKDSQVGVETSLTSGLLDERMQPVDKEVFMRELNYYQLVNGQ